MPRKTKSGEWIVDERPNGVKGKRVRRTFSSYAEANRFQAYILSQAAQGLPWNPKPSDTRRLSQLIEEWHQLHGRTLSNGHRQLAILNKLCDALGDPIARDLAEADFMKFRANSTLTPKTLNNQLGYLNAVYNRLHKAKVIDYTSPLKGLEPIKYERRELHYLDVQQMLELLSTARRDDNEDVYLCTRLCLETGARWSEAETVKRSMVRRQEDRCSVTFTDTKGKRARTVPIAYMLYLELRRHNKPHERVFGRCMRQFNRVASNLSFKLPPQQNTHILRHTFASHFVMKGGNILVLQKILGHADIKETMRYAHLAPEHLESALTLGPLSGQKVDIEEPEETLDS